MIQQGVYRHWRGGLYTVIMAARCSDNGPNEGDDVVVYVSHTTGSVCTRLAKEFFEKVDAGKHGPVVMVDRFSFVASGLAVVTGVTRHGS